MTDSDQTISDLCCSLHELSFIPSNGTQGAARSKDLCERLRRISRNPINGKALIGLNVVPALLDIGLDFHETQETRQDALSTVSNLLLINEEYRKNWDARSYSSHLAFAYSSAPSDSLQFLLARILFLLTFRPSNYPSNVVHIIFEGIYEHTQKFVEQGVKRWQRETLNETLKLSFHLNLAFPEGCKTDFVPCLTRLLLKFDADRETDMCLQIVNCMMNLPVTFADYFPTYEPTQIVEKLFTLLDRILPSSSTTSVDEAVGSVAAPLLVLLYNAFGETESLRVVKSYYRMRLLPSHRDRQWPLGHAPSLSGRLIRLASGVSANQSQQVILQLLWAVSDCDALQLIKNVGLGCAYGFLVSNSIQIPDNLGEHYINDRGCATDIMTGQYVESRQVNTSSLLEEMTDEEKEREAERLFVLFERIKSNGVLKVENPIATAASQGGLEVIEE